MALYTPRAITFRIAFNTVKLAYKITLGLTLSDFCNYLHMVSPLEITCDRTIATKLIWLVMVENFSLQSMYEQFR